jgi:tRNA-dihydrouridine synthase B
MLQDPMELRGLRLRNRVVLAPLAGVTDVPFRRICREFGAGLTFVEMLSAEALVRGNRRTRDMMARHPDEEILGVQITGREPAEVGRAVAICDGLGFDAIDLNMGCPVRKIVGSGCGAAYLQDPSRVAPVVAAARAATAKPLSVKCRLGFFRKTRNVETVAADAVKSGADMLTVHGRFREDDYGVPVDLDGIRLGLDAARAAAAGQPLATVGNGDITDAAAALAMAARTGCDAVMVSRGALGNPWIFSDVLAGETRLPTIVEWREVVLRHLAYHEEHHGGDEMSARRVRKHLIWYACGFPRSNRLRDRFNQVTSLTEARELVAGYAACYPPSLRRFEDPDAALAVAVAEGDPKWAMDREADRSAAADGLAG